MSINKQTVKTYCKDYTRIENYDKAIVDTTQTWECHHRLEIAPFSGKKVSRKFLIEQDLYYDQPPEALIFLTTFEHSSLHHRGKKVPEDVKKKISEAKKGKKLSEEQKRKISETMKGKKKSEETRKRMSEANTGKHLSEETKKKLSESHRGKKGNTTNLGRRWYNNGVKSMMAFTCPNGFVPGRICRRK